jgi:Domain of unknown function DUF11
MTILKALAVAVTILGIVQGPTIRHQGLEYVSSRQFPRVEVEVDLPDLVRSAKLYFRAEQYSDFYYVEMVRDEDRDTFFAILPMPLAETAAMIYFVEVVDTALNPIRSAVFEAKVTAQAVPGSFQGAQPNINVGSTAPPGASEVPPGFQNNGIQGVINPDGTIRPLTETAPAVKSDGGGGGVAAAVLIGAGAAVGVGYLVLKQQEEETPPPVPTADLSVTKTPSVTGDVPVRAPITFELRAVNGGPDRATNVQLTDNVPSGYRINRTEFPNNATCGLSGQLIQCSAPALDAGASIRVVYEASGIEPLVTLTNRVEVRATEIDPNSSNNSASVTINIVRPPRQTPVADITVDVRLANTNVYQVDLRNLGPTGTVSDIDLEVSASGVSVEFVDGNVTSSGFTNGCPRDPQTPNGLFSCGTSLGPDRIATVTFRVDPLAEGTLRITAATACDSIDPNCSNNTDSVETVIIRTKDEAARVSTAFSSLIEDSSHRRLRGDATLNGQSLGTLTSGSPRRISANGFAGGANVVEAWTTSASDGDGRWEFSFQNTPGFARGSLVVESGQVLLLEGDRVVFRLNGAPGERLRFRFGLER